jgi:nitroreductase
MFIDLLRQRRSIRRFQTRPVEKEKIEILVEAALRAPSSRGFNPWEFFVVTDSKIIDKLSSAKPHGASFLKNAPLAVVVCADTSKSDVWIEDAAIASLILHLTASDLGLGSCWIQIRLREHDAHQSAQEYIAGMLDLKEGLAVLSMVAIGYPMEEKSGHSKASLPLDKVHFVNEMKGSPSEPR